MAIEKQVSNESQIALSLISKQRSSHFKRKKHDDELCLFRSPSNSLGPPPSNSVIIIDDDDEEETLEYSRKNKKPRIGSWWYYNDAINELSIVVKGSTKPKHHDNEIASKVDSHFSSSDLHEKKKKDDYHKRSSPTSTVTDEDLSVDENVGCENPTTSMKGYRHVSLDELGLSVEDLKSMPWEALDHEKKKKNDDSDKRSSPTSTVTHQDLCVDENVGFENPTTSMQGIRHVSLEELGVSVEDLKSMPWEAFDHEKKKKKDDCDKRSSPTLTVTHQDLCVDENVGCENPTTSMKGNSHVSLEELGVSVEDLKSMPWEAFDPTWEIKSATMDPWLGGYIQDMFPPP